MAVSEERFAVKTTSDSHFAWVRTRLALERTIMAWIRTATALIGFGFTIVQFFERLSSMEGVAPAMRPAAPRYVGLLLIAAGIFALAASLWQYHRVIGYMWGEPFTPLAGMSRKPHQTPVYLVSVALLFVGVFAFVAVLTRAI
jgi:putative membrane protein